MIRCLCVSSIEESGIEESGETRRRVNGLLVDELPGDGLPGEDLPQACGFSRTDDIRAGRGGLRHGSGRDGQL